MLFVCHPKILHKHCLQFLLGVKQCLCKILGWRKKSIMVCYGIFWSGQFSRFANSLHWYIHKINSAEFFCQKKKKKAVSHSWSRVWFYNPDKEKPSQFQIIIKKKTPRGDGLGLPSPQASLLRAADDFLVTWSKKLFTEMHWLRRPGKTPYRD